MVPLIAFLCVEACGGGPEPMPTTLDGCAALSDDGQREDCRLQVLGPLYTKNRKAFDEGLKTVDDPLSRDLVRLRLAIDDPSSAEELCKEVETDGAREKCRQVLGRPHLRAKRHDDEGPDGAEPPPGPPPGSPPPGSPPSGSP